MNSYDVWRGIDRQAFHENAILLDSKVRSQGDPVRSVPFHDGQVQSDEQFSPQFVRHVLDDFALVLSGTGGSENVSAICMEIDPALHKTILRVSGNDGISGQKLADFENLLQLTMTEPMIGSPARKCSDGASWLTCQGEPHLETRHEQVLTDLLRQCGGRFVRHAIALRNEFTQARCPPATSLEVPVFTPANNSTTESSNDLKELGPYDRHTHGAYMQRSRERLCRIRNICTSITTATDEWDVCQMRLLAKLAYEVRRSSSFHQFLRLNILFTPKPKAVQAMADGLKERLGKLSRFWRAATFIMSFGLHLRAQHQTIQVLTLQSARHEVRELCNRTIAQIRGRGGRGFQSCNEVTLQQKLRLWPSYRVHCEMQLIIFYAENPQLRLQSRYIGCDKLACFMCYTFIKAHGAFEINGCHQGLHSLWTVPRMVSFDSEDHAQQFQEALGGLASALERKVNAIRQTPRVPWKFRTNSESTANLSRVSINLPPVSRDVIIAAAVASQNIPCVASSSASNSITIGRSHIVKEIDSPNVVHSPPPNATAESDAGHEAAPSPQAVDAHQEVFSTTNDQGRQVAYHQTGQVCKLQIDRDHATHKTVASCTDQDGLSVYSADDVLGVPPRLNHSTLSGAVSLLSWNKERYQAGDSDQSARPPRSQRTGSLWQAGVGPENETDSSSSSTRAIQSVPQLSDPGQRQSRPVLDLEQSSYGAADHMKGHESRFCDMLSECGISDQVPFDPQNMPQSDGMNRRIDFYDSKLHLESECPAAMQITVTPCRRPHELSVDVVVNIDHLGAGEEIEVDTCHQRANDKIMFLTKQDHRGTEYWWEICWTRKVRPHP